MRSGGSAACGICFRKSAWLLPDPGPSRFPVPDFPCPFGLPDEHVVAVARCGAPFGSPPQKFRERRIVDQIEQKVSGADSLVRNGRVSFRGWVGSQRRRVDDQPAVRHRVRSQGSVPETALVAVARHAVERNAELSEHITDRLRGSAGSEYERPLRSAPPSSESSERRNPKASVL